MIIGRRGVANGYGLKDYNPHKRKNFIVWWYHALRHAPVLGNFGPKTLPIKFLVKPLHDQLKKFHSCITQWGLQHNISATIIQGPRSIILQKIVIRITGLSRSCLLSWLPTFQTQIFRGFSWMILVFILFSLDRSVHQYILYYLIIS
jgi:hypothetical protein